MDRLDKLKQTPPPPSARFPSLDIPADNGRPPRATTPGKDSCQLTPPCKHGRHSDNYAPHQPHARPPNTLGKYHLTEEGLKHDLSALKKGKIYRRSDFLIRARAWYKAEIDRQTHLERVRAEEQVETQRALSLKPRPGIQGKRRPRRRRPSTPSAPTRVQPPREAKRKAIERSRSRSGSPAGRRVKKRKTEERDTASSGGLKAEGTTSVGVGVEGEETKGEYVLATYDFARHKSAAAAREGGSSPFEYVHPQGEAAYFVTRLTRVVDARVEALMGERRRRGSVKGKEMDTGGKWMCALGSGYKVEENFVSAVKSSPVEGRARMAVVVGGERAVVVPEEVDEEEFELDLEADLKERFEEDARLEREFEAEWGEVLGEDDDLFGEGEDEDEDEDEDYPLPDEEGFEEADGEGRNDGVFAEDEEEREARNPFARPDQPVPNPFGQPPPSTPSNPFGQPVSPDKPNPVGERKPSAQQNPFSGRKRSVQSNPFGHPKIPDNPPNPFHERNSSTQSSLFGEASSPLAQTAPDEPNLFTPRKPSAQPNPSGQPNSPEKSTPFGQRKQSAQPNPFSDAKTPERSGPFADRNLFSHSNPLGIYFSSPTEISPFTQPKSSDQRKQTVAEKTTERPEASQEEGRRDESDVELLDEPTDPTKEPAKEPPSQSAEPPEQPPRISQNKPSDDEHQDVPEPSIREHEEYIPAHPSQPTPPPEPQTQPQVSLPSPEPSAPSSAPSSPAISVPVPPAPSPSHTTSSPSPAPVASSPPAAAEPSHSSHLSQKERHKIIEKEVFGYEEGGSEGEGFWDQNDQEDGGIISEVPSPSPPSSVGRESAVGASPEGDEVATPGEGDGEQDVVILVEGKDENEEGVEDEEGVGVGVVEVVELEEVVEVVEAKVEILEEVEDVSEVKEDAGEVGEEGFEDVLDVKMEDEEVKHEVDDEEMKHAVMSGALGQRESDNDPTVVWKEERTVLEDVKMDTVDTQAAVDDEERFSDIYASDDDQGKETIHVKDESLDREPDAVPVTHGRRFSMYVPEVKMDDDVHEAEDVKAEAIKNEPMPQVEDVPMAERDDDDASVEKLSPTQSPSVPVRTEAQVDVDMADDPGYETDIDAEPAKQPETQQGPTVAEARLHDDNVHEQPSQEVGEPIEESRYEDQGSLNKTDSEDIEMTGTVHTAEEITGILREVDERTPSEPTKEPSPAPKPDETLEIIREVIVCEGTTTSAHQPSEPRVPEATMVISPTLGKWVQEPKERKDSILEDHIASHLELSGLKFAVDVCGLISGEQNEALVIMV